MRKLALVLILSLGCIERATAQEVRTQPSASGSDVVLHNPTCQEIQIAINTWIDEDGPKRDRDLLVKLSGKLRISEAVLLGRNFRSGYNVCVALVPTKTVTKGFPVGDATTNRGWSNERLHLVFDRFHVELSSRDQTVPMIFLQLGNGYHKGRWSRTDANWVGGSWVRYINLSGSLTVEASGCSKGTWPTGRVPRLPFSGPNFPRSSKIGIFASSVQESDMQDLSYRFHGCGLHSGDIGWLKMTGWSNTYPAMTIRYATIGSWWMGNSIGAWYAGSVLDSNGINVLIGGPFGGSAPVHPSCASGNCGVMQREAVSGLSVFGVTAAEAYASDWVITDAADLSFYGLRSESGARWPTDPHLLGDHVVLGAGFCAPGSRDPLRNRLPTDDSVEDWPCHDDYQCGTGKCLVSDFGNAGVDYYLEDIVIEGRVMGTGFHNKFQPLAIGPAAVPREKFKAAYKGTQVTLIGSFYPGDTDETENWPKGFLAANLPPEGMTNGSCTAQGGNRCWVGDLRDKRAGARCEGTGTVNHDTSTGWALCKWAQGQWRVTGGPSCFDQDDLDCGLLDWHPAARVRINAAEQSVPWFSFEAESFYPNLIRLPHEYRYHSTECTSIIGAPRGAKCFEEDDDTLYVCEASKDGICDIAEEWTAVSAAGVPLQPVMAKTTSATLSTFEARASLITNKGASEAITLTLPSAQAGMCVSIFLAEPQDIDVAPATGDKIVGVTDSVGEKISSDAAVGSMIRLCALNSVEWAVLGQRGDWSRTRRARP